jgi:hypothetical protein
MAHSPKESRMAYEYKNNDLRRVNDLSPEEVRDSRRPKAQIGPRPTEDDIAKAKLGPRGVPGERDKPARDPDELQIPKALDPGHTA